jgi:hypothetical protein
MRLALFIALGVLLLAPQAAAGGGWWSVVEVTRGPVAAGERVQVRAGLLFSSDAVAETAQQPGRYRVYLLRGFDDSGVERAMRKAKPGDWWSLGSAEAIDVGPVTVPGTEANFGEATAEFTVPQLAAGTYHVMLCDAGCAEPLTDVIPTEGFTVVADPTTATLAQQVARLARRNREQTRELVAARDETYEALVTAQDARAAYEDLRVRVASVANQDRSSSPPTGWLVAGALVLLVLAGLARARHQAHDPGARRGEDVQSGAPVGPGDATVLDGRWDHDTVAGTHDAGLASRGERQLS